MCIKKGCKYNSISSNGIKYLQCFDKIFQTDTCKNLNFENMKLLKKIYEYFEDELYSKPTDKYKKLQSEYIKASKKLEEKLSSQQQELFEKCWEAYNLMADELQEQLFIFGYIFALELNTEAKNNKLL